jgi:hypothetical protein
MRTQSTAADNQPLASSGRRSGCSSSKILHELASSIGSPKVNLAFITSKQILDWGESRIRHHSAAAFCSAAQCRPLFRVRHDLFVAAWPSRLTYWHTCAWNLSHTVDGSLAILTLTRGMFRDLGHRTWV